MDIVLIIDEFDSIKKLDKKTREIFLSELRTLKQQRVQNVSNCLQSVLGITNWVGD